jgi:TRAP-type C4-dicarboxylate transport system permease small subunit
VNRTGQIMHSRTDPAERVLKLLSLAGTAAIALGALLTMADIGLRSVSTLTVKGIVDIMQLCVLAGAMLAIPHGFITDQHVAIDLFVERLPARVQVALRVFAALLGIAFLAAVFWFGLQQAMTEYGDRSQTIGIPMIWYWVPFLAGMGLSVLASLVVAMRLLRDGLPPRRHEGLEA